MLGYSTERTCTLDINNRFIELILCARYCSTYEVLSKSLESIVLFPFTDAEIVSDLQSHRSGSALSLILEQLSSTEIEHELQIQFIYKVLNFLVVAL